MRSESFLAQRDEEVAVGDNTGCGRSGSSVLRSDFNWSPLHIHTQLAACLLHSDLRRIRLWPNLPGRSYCVSYGVPVLKLE